MKRKKEINIQLIPVYIPDAEFQEKKAEIQNLIARMVVSVYEDVDDKKPIIRVFEPHMLKTRTHRFRKF